MSGKIKQWFLRNQNNILWFLIGWLVTSGIRDLLMGNYIGAFISFAIAYVNYAINR